jgi:hypothetical protein
MIFSSPGIITRRSWISRRLKSFFRNCREFGEGLFGHGIHPVLQFMAENGQGAAVAAHLAREFGIGFSCQNINHNPQDFRG